ncbi:EAL domain-containing protein [Tepidiforma flava]|uniref:EAL domain-containing protein n=1 Tax=Tepidiforma flava TaxID=3004094 RepID=A0ABY7M2T1_9CHLR|nr:EAL domain-containing protein [Tepidiforma flava]WBL34966.1 EAL domain-containing protein [Tepidiforma flava]
MRTGARRSCCGRPTWRSTGRRRRAGRGSWSSRRSWTSDPAERFDLDNALRRAVERQELELLYQPVVDLETGALVGMEALLRWNHPHRGVLSPATFISIAEESGEIVRIGQWVLERGVPGGGSGRRTCGRAAG